jgi:hypothetical protein
MLGDFADQLRDLVPFVFATRIVQGIDVALPLFCFSALLDMSMDRARCTWTIGGTVVQRNPPKETMLYSHSSSSLDGIIGQHHNIIHDENTMP